MKATDPAHPSATRPSRARWAAEVALFLLKPVPRYPDSSLCALGPGERR